MTDEMGTQGAGGCPHCESRATCSCPSGREVCPAGTCPCPPGCPCREAEPGPGCLPALLLWKWPIKIIGFLIVVVVLVVVLLNDGDGDDGESLVVDSTTVTEPSPSSEPPSSTEASTTTTTIAEVTDTTPESSLVIDTSTSAPPLVEGPESTLAETTTTTEPPRWADYPTEIGDYLDSVCAVTVPLGDQEFIEGPPEGGTPPREPNPPAAVRLDHVSYEISECGEKQLIIGVRLVEALQDVQTSLVLDFPADLAGNDGFVADPNAPAAIGQTGGWDVFFEGPMEPTAGSPVGVMTYDHEFSPLDLGAMTLAIDDTILFVVDVARLGLPIDDPAQLDLALVAQSFHRNGDTAESPIAFTAIKAATAR